MAKFVYDMYNNVLTALMILYIISPLRLSEGYFMVLEDNIVRLASLLYAYDAYLPRDHRQLVHWSVVDRWNYVEL